MKGSNSEADPQPRTSRKLGAVQFFIRPRFYGKRLFLGQVLWQADAMLFDRIISNDP
jgi:hypothetical protein